MLYHAKRKKSALAVNTYTSDIIRWNWKLVSGGEGIFIFHSKIGLVIYRSKKRPKRLITVIECDLEVILSISNESSFSIQKISEWIETAS